MVEHLAKVVEETGAPADFTLLSQSKTTETAKINDATFEGRPELNELGTNLGLLERGIVFQELEKVPPFELPANSREPILDGLMAAMKALESRGFTPDIVCAPIDLMEAIMMVPPLGIIWDITPAELNINTIGATVKLLWSSGLAPLGGMVVYDSRQTTYRVRVDPATGKRLTALVKEDGDSAAVTGETLAKFEVSNPDAVCFIPLDVIS